MKKLNIGIITALSVMGVSTIVVPTVVAVTEPQVVSSKVNVSLKDSPHVSIDVNEGEKDRSLTINFKADANYMLFAVADVFVNGNQIDVYDYDYYANEDRTEAQMYIPAYAVTGDITIQIRTIQTFDVFDIQFNYENKWVLNGFSDAYFLLSDDEKTGLIGSYLDIPYYVDEVAPNAFFGMDEYGTNMSLLPSETYFVWFEQDSECMRIGENAFRESNIIYVNLPQTVAEIGQGAFMGCTLLSYIFLPESIQTIGRNAFLGCRSLYQINLPYSLETIGKNAFTGCSTLSEIWIDRVFDIYPEGYDPEAFGTTGDVPFTGYLITKTNYTATAMKLCCLPLALWETVEDTTYYDYVFDWDWDYFTGYTIKGFSSYFLSLSVEEQQRLIGNDHCLTIPCADIADNAFYNAETNSSTMPSWITSLDFDEDMDNDLNLVGCQKIGKNAFRDWSNLKTVNFISTINTIGDSAFFGCSGMNLISVAELGAAVPAGWGDVADIFDDASDSGIIYTSPLDTTNAWSTWFKNEGSPFTTWEVDPVEFGIYNIIDISGTTTLIGFSSEFLSLSAEQQQLVMDPINANTMYIPEDVEYIFGNSFVSDGTNTIPTWVQHIDFGAQSKLRTIGRRFLYNNLSVKSIGLPSTLHTIDNDAFSYSSLQTITFPSTWQANKAVFGASVFDNAKKLHIIDLRDCGAITEQTGMPWDSNANYGTFYNVGTTAQNVDIGELTLSFSAGQGMILVAPGSNLEFVQSYFVTQSKQNALASPTMIFDDNHWVIDNTESLSNK